MLPATDSFSELTALVPAPPGAAVCDGAGECRRVGRDEARAVFQSGHVLVAHAAFVAGRLKAQPLKPLYDVLELFAFLKPGDTVMQIVPLKDAIEVEARVRPEDADNVHVGMPARVSFGAYSARRMPMILGTVNNVSADRQVDERTGQAYFTVNVTVDRGKLTDYRDVKLMPGLPVDVALGTGSRTALQYFAEPITDVFRKGMRER